MPRANRIIMPGCLYHLTHRCHDRRFLFRFGLGRTEYRNRLRQAASDFSVRLLAYCITSNHTHLLVEAGELKRRAMRTESIVVGDLDFVEGVASGMRKRRRLHREEVDDGVWVVREDPAPYNRFSAPKIVSKGLLKGSDSDQLYCFHRLSVVRPQSPEAPISGSRKLFHPAP